MAAISRRAPPSSVVDGADPAELLDDAGEHVSASSGSYSRRASSSRVVADSSRHASASAIVPTSGWGNAEQSTGAEHRGRDVRDETVDQPGGEQRAVQGRAAFDHRLQDVAAAEEVEGRFEVDASRGRGDGLDLRARRLPARPPPRTALLRW